MNPLLSQNLPIATEVYIAVSDSGDVNKELLQVWLKHFYVHVKEKTGKTAAVIITRDEEATTEYTSTDDNIDESLIWTDNINVVVEVPLEVIIKPAFMISFVTCVLISENIFYVLHGFLIIIVMVCVSIKISINHVYLFQICII